LLERYADEVTSDGRRRLVRHGHLPAREIVTGIGPVAVHCPRVRDRVGEGPERIRFSSAILPPYARRSKSLEVLIPILYLKGISTGDFEQASAALRARARRDDQAGLPPEMGAADGNGWLRSCEGRARDRTRAGHGRETPIFQTSCLIRGSTRQRPAGPRPSTRWGASLSKRGRGMKAPRRWTRHCSARTSRRREGGRQWERCAIYPTAFACARANTGRMRRCVELNFFHLEPTCLRRRPTEAIQWTLPAGTGLQRFCAFATPPQRKDQPDRRPYPVLAMLRARMRS
jgi:hypothetical protein